MSSVLDLGGCPEIFVAGVANVFSRDGITYVTLYSWAATMAQPIALSLASSL
jgi:hypothetical protein